MNSELLGTFFCQHVQANEGSNDCNIPVWFTKEEFHRLANVHCWFLPMQGRNLKQICLTHHQFLKIYNLDLLLYKSITDFFFWAGVNKILKWHYSGVTWKNYIFQVLISVYYWKMQDYSNKMQNTSFPAFPIALTDCQWLWDCLASRRQWCSHVCHPNGSRGSTPCMEMPSSDTEPTDSETCVWIAARLPYYLLCVFFQTFTWQDETDK